MESTFIDKALDFAFTKVFPAIAVLAMIVIVTDITQFIITLFGIWNATA